MAGSIVRTRQQLIHELHEAAEPEQNLMRANLYVAFILKESPTG